MAEPTEMVESSIARLIRVAEHNGFRPEGEEACSRALSGYLDIVNHRY